MTRRELRYGPGGPSLFLFFGRSEDLPGAGHVLVDEHFFEFAINGDEGPAAARTVNTCVFGHRGVFTGQVAKINKAFHT